MPRASPGLPGQPRKAKAEEETNLKPAALDAKADAALGFRSRVDLLNAPADSVVDLLEGPLGDHLGDFLVGFLGVSFGGLLWDSSWEIPWERSPRRIPWVSAVDS